MKSSRKSRLFRQLLATTLLIGGPFQLTAPVLAQTTPAPTQSTTTPTGTRAGTEIRNTATGTYEDPNQPGQQINTTSNTVTITVAEVAGITVTGTGVVDVNGGTIQANDIINYDFRVTNVGNDATRIFIPDTATVNGPGTVANLRYSTDGGQTYTDVPAGGLTTGSVAAGDSVLVRVRVSANAGATAGTPIDVTLGNTDPANAQNVAVGTPAANDVRTVDNTGTEGGDASAAAPANGEREASATQSTNLGAALEILNGPNGQPAATATTNNDDFTNASTAVQAGLAPDQRFNPEAKTITNTIKDNTGTDPEVVSLRPTAPADPAALPDGTLVTISYGTGGTAQTAVYRYAQATGFTFEPAGSTGTAANDPVEINLAAGGTESYQVTIDLPDGTAQFTAFPVPIRAFLDSNDDGVIDAGEVGNTTIDRVYTGFLRLTKESRIVQGEGPTVPAGQNTFSTGPKTPAPGNIIEYRITYQNISEPNQGSGNLILNASQVAITEDGTTATNNWAVDSDNNNVIDTSNVTGQAADSNGGTITFTPGGDKTGTTAQTDVTRYVDTVPGQIAPGARGTFTFQRKVN